MTAPAGFWHNRHMESVILREARREDAHAISALIHELMPYLTLAPDGAGAEQFKASMSAAAVERYVAEPNYRYWMAYAGAELAGVVAMRDNRHLFHLFVARALHGRGLARQLWNAAGQAALEAGNTEGYTVNSSPSALPIYLRFGFVPTGPRVEQHGIAYIPMRLA